MKIKWNAELDEHLHPRLPGGLSTLYHENSKLFPELARQQAAGLAMQPMELYLSSRGFRQHAHLPAVALPEPTPSDAPLSTLLRGRRSQRELAGPVTLAQLATILQGALGPTMVVRSEREGVTQALRAWPSAGGLYPIDTYVVARSVTGLEPGVYHYNISTAGLERMPARAPELVLRDGFFWQDWCTSAAVGLVFVGVFERTMAKYGERGYRLVLLDAGHAGQNVLLVSEQERVSACAVAGFCDDALAADLGVDGVDESVIHTIVLGTREA